MNTLTKASRHWAPVYIRKKFKAITSVVIFNVFTLHFIRTSKRSAAPEPLMLEGGNNRTHLTTA